VNDDQNLLESHQEVIDLRRFSLRLGFGDPAENEDVLLALMPEHHPVTAISLLDCGHVALPFGQCHRDATSSLLPFCYLKRVTELTWPSEGMPQPIGCIGNARGGS